MAKPKGGILGNGQVGSALARGGGQHLTTFAASDHMEAQDLVLVMAREIGFDAVDAGPLANARLIESLGALDVQLGYTLGMGTQIGFKFMRG